MIYEPESLVCEFFKTSEHFENLLDLFLLWLTPTLSSEEEFFTSLKAHWTHFLQKSILISYSSAINGPELRNCNGILNL